jgi:2-polyprenyl-3-methyl-5-hydroxy-6-metoxy-1,4-benzoquinol methylase
LLIDAVGANAGRVCDLGCGNGTFAIELAPNAGHIVGVDQSSSGIDVAKRSLGSLENVSFVESAIDAALPSRLLQNGGPFDVVVSIDVIEHLLYPRILIDVAWQVLRPGGRLIVCTPYHGYLKNLAISLAGGWDAHHGVGWDGGHIKFFSVRTLSAMVSERGFEDVSFRYFGRAPYLWKNMICLARKPRDRI